MPNQQQPEPRAIRLEELQRRRQRRKLRRLALLAVAAALAVFVLSGSYKSILSMLTEASDSVRIFFDRSGSFPVQTGVAEPLQVLELGGGFVELSQDDVLVYSATGSLLRSLQPSYARPAICAGNTRFCVYNRSGTELRVESRTQNLHTLRTEQSILLCSMSGNGSLAVVTRSTRYAAEMNVYDPTMELCYIWNTTEAEGVPVRVSFAADDHRMAAGCIAVSGGLLVSNVYLLDTQQDHVMAQYRHEGGMLLELVWLSTNRLLCVYEDRAVLLDTTDGEELAAYSYNGETLTSLSVSDRNVALLLSSHTGSRLVVLNKKLSAQSETDIPTANKVVCVHSAAYVLRDSAVECYSLQGESQWSRSLTAQPRALLNAEQLLLFVDGRVEVLTAEGEEPEATAPIGNRLTEEQLAEAYEQAEAAEEPEADETQEPDAEHGGQPEG